MTTISSFTDEELVEKRFLLEKLIDLTDNPIEKWMLDLKLTSVVGEISWRNLPAVAVNFSLKWADEDEQPQSQCDDLIRIDDDDFVLYKTVCDFVNGIDLAQIERNS